MKFNKIIPIFILCSLLPLVLPRNMQLNLALKSIESPHSSGSISYLIIRPDSDIVNSGFSSNPASGYLFSKINDTVNFPNANGDSDYIIGDDGDSCELEMSDISLGSYQKVVEITLFARGKREGTPGDVHYLDLEWRIGSGPYSADRSLQFTSYSFSWLFTSSWNGLNLSQNDVNNLRLSIGMVGSYVDRFQDISVLYLNLTIETNYDPSVSLNTPNGGEIAFNSIQIEWEYYDNDLDNLTFNLYYKISLDEWIPIITGLVNVDNFNWDLTEFNETYSEVLIKINATDGWGGYNEDFSDEYFTIRYNHSPLLNITYPIGGEILQNFVIISWNYIELDGDTIRFNISYQISGGNWIPIVQELVNTTSYEWDISSFTERLENVNIKIEGIDDFGAKIEIMCQNNFTIIPVELSPNILEFLPFIIIGSSIAIASISFSIYMRKSRQKKAVKQKIAKIKNKYIDKSTNGTKKIIIEADLLVKRGTKYDQKDLLNLLFSDDEITNEKDYESIKVLGKLNITTLSEDFWEKIEKFKWENDDKEDFINDMLSLPQNCREQFIDEMLERFEVSE